MHLCSCLLNSSDLSETLNRVQSARGRRNLDHSHAPGDKDGRVVMGVVAIIQDILTLLPDAEVL